MDILQNILGGGQQRQQFQDFANRYQQGAPYDGISDQEALQHYQQVAPHLPPQMWEESAQESFARLSPQQRMELGRYLQQGAQQRGVSFPDMNRDGVDDRCRPPAIWRRWPARCASNSPASSASCWAAHSGAGRWAAG